MNHKEINAAIADQFPRLFIIRKPMHAPFQYYREDACGYTNNIADAWKVSEDVARKHSCGDAKDHDRVIYEPAPIPNYASDLNAIHKAWQTLTHVQKLAYRSELALIAARESINRQSCWMEDIAAEFGPEAFLRVVGKWTDEKGGDREQ